MANRYMNQFMYSVEKSKVVLYMKVAIGASGAPTMSSSNSKGVKSITRTGTGAYTIVLSDVWGRLLNVQFATLNSTSTVNTLAIAQDHVATAASPQIQVVFQSAPGTAADPANGDTMLLQITLSNDDGTVF